MAAPKTSELIEGVNKNISDLMEVVKSVADRVGALEAKKDVPVEVTQVVPAQELSIPRSNVPTGTVRIVEAMLNNKFIPRVEPSFNPAAFRLIVSVPRVYSQAGDAHWVMYKKDECIGEIEIAKGEAGVKEYIERLFALFPPATQALIVADRR